MAPDLIRLGSRGEASSSAAQPKSVQPQQRSLSSRVILVAEDNLDEFAVMQTAYAGTRLPYRLEHVQTGRGVLDYLIGNGPYANRQKFPYPELLILDLNMPLLSGFDVLNILLRITRLPRLPVAVMSNSTLASERNATLHLGACCAYMKPNSVQEMQRILAEIVSKCIQQPGSG
jgi:CheY-like chemotaxis protein